MVGENEYKGIYESTSLVKLIVSVELALRDLSNIKDGTAEFAPCKFCGFYFLGGKSMDDLSMQDLISSAIILIYPDGTVEKVPISNEYLHIKYFCEILKTSPRFYELCKGLDFDKSAFHGHIDKHLAINGVITIINLDIENIVDGYFDFNSNVPYLYASLPERLHSLEQTLKLEQIFKNYPKFDYEKYDSRLKKYDYDINMEEYIAGAKEEFGTRGI